MYVSTTIPCLERRDEDKGCKLKLYHQQHNYTGLATTNEISDCLRVCVSVCV